MPIDSRVGLPERFESSACLVDHDDFIRAGRGGYQPGVHDGRQTGATLPVDQEKTRILAVVLALSLKRN